MKKLFRKIIDSILRIIWGIMVGFLAGAVVGAVIVLALSVIVGLTLIWKGEVDVAGIGAILNTIVAALFTAFIGSAMGAIAGSIVGAISGLVAAISYQVFPRREMGACVGIVWSLATVYYFRVEIEAAYGFAAIGIAAWLAFSCGMIAGVIIIWELQRMDASRATTHNLHQ